LTKGLLGFFLAPTGRPAVPRIARWMMVKDKVSFRGKVGQLAAIPDLKRVIVSHGAMMTEAPGEKLKSALDVL
jgi:hypothetical protein